MVRTAPGVTGLRPRLLAIAVGSGLLVVLFGVESTLGGYLLLGIRQVRDDVTLRALGWALAVGGLSGLATSAALAVTALTARAAVTRAGVEVGRLHRPIRALGGCRVAQLVTAAGLLGLGLWFSLGGHGGAGPLLAGAALTVPVATLVVPLTTVRGLLRRATGPG